MKCFKTFARVLALLVFLAVAFLVSLAVGAFVQSFAGSELGALVSTLLTVFIAGWGIHNLGPLVDKILPASSHG